MTFRATFEHRDELLRAALSEFGERGYDNASINRILAASAVSKGQLYHHFASKEGLFLALVEWMIDRKVEWVARRTFEPADDFMAVLRSQFTVAADFARAHPDVEQMSRAVLAERGRPIYAQIVRRFGFDEAGALAGLVDQAYERGEFRNDLSLDFVRRAVLVLVNNLPELIALDEPDDMRRGIEELLTFLRGGLLAG